MVFLFFVFFLNLPLPLKKPLVTLKICLHSGKNQTLIELAYKFWDFFECQFSSSGIQAIWLGWDNVAYE